MSGLEDLRKSLEDAGLLIAVPADSENVVIPRDRYEQLLDCETRVNVASDLLYKKDLYSAKHWGTLCCGINEDFREILGIVESADVKDVIKKYKESEKNMNENDA